MFTRVPFYVFVTVIIASMLTSGTVNLQSRNPQSPSAAKENVFNYQGRSISEHKPATTAIESTTNSFTASKFVPQWEEFSETDSLNVPRRFASAVMLQNGKVLIVGGWNGSACVTSAELYDPDAGTWSTTGSMNTGRCAHTTTLLQNGDVLAAGGGNVTQLSSAELYHPSTGTWSLTGSMRDVRDSHRATLLNDGKVLVSGGFNGYDILYDSTELYDPSTGLWTIKGSMHNGRSRHTSTLLNNGMVLVTGGYGSTPIANAEIYDPYTGYWSTTDSMNVGRAEHTATLLRDGKVLVAGGDIHNTETASAELCDPTNHSWSTTGSMNYSRRKHTATLLGYGKVLVTGGSIGTFFYDLAELYDPSKGTWSTSASMNIGRIEHTTTMLNDIQVLVAGGNNGGSLESAEIGTFAPANTLTGTLILPSGWLTSTAFTVQFSGVTSDIALKDGALSNDNTTWGEWTALSSGVFTTTTWDVGSDGSDMQVYLRLRDIYDQTATIISGTVDVDSTAPVAAVSPLSPTQNSTTFAVSWSGIDTTSGIKDFDIQYKDGNGSWTDWITGTVALTADFTGQENHTYYFRTRARDNAGNSGDYSVTNIQTTIDVYPYDLFLPVVSK